MKPQALILGILTLAACGNPPQEQTAKLYTDRPPVEERAFISPAIDSVTEAVAAQITHPKLAEMFRKCFPNTLDTTVHYSEDENGEPVDPSYGSNGIDNEGRIFPASMKARDVLDVLTGEASLNGWQTEMDARVCGLRKDGPWELTLTNGYELRAEKVVIASGGITYPETGSDGSMLGILADLGIDINEPRPALAPVYVENYPYSELSGISVPDVTVIAFSSDAAYTCKGKAARMKGDLLFTHEGLSGPVILNISKYTEPGEMIRLCYNKELHELPRRMQRILRERSRGLLGDVRTNVLAGFLNQDDFIVSGVDERGMVTAGGVSLDGIDMKTMRIRDHEGLYAIGEAIDADGITGGYNLQLCWSTAAAAADDLRGEL